MTRYLTKSRFKLANECPTKLFYTKKKEYHDAGLQDEFLAALAEGGHQVGELAKALFPGGHEVETLDYEKSLAQTASLLEQQEVTIYEPAFRCNTLFVRVDILVKRGNKVRLVEVKAKSCRGEGEDQFLTKKGSRIAGRWLPYLEDVAFQHHVVAQARPDWEITPELMLVDKDKVCPTDGLHQKFLLRRDEAGRSHCEQTQELTEEELSNGLLSAIPLEQTLRLMVEERRYGPGEQHDFVSWIDYLAEKYAADDRIKPRPASYCKACQFRANVEQRAEGLRSGFHECWNYAFDLSEDQLAMPTVLDLWSYRKKDALLSSGRPLLTDLQAEDVGSPTIGNGPMEPAERQWLQVELAQGKRGGVILRPGLREVMRGWTYPLHCIDFETMMPAIPMHAGCRPYEQIAFQFSHHLIREDGRVDHAGEWIEERQGAFPNFDFVRALRQELAEDDGTVFRFAPHENTVLCAIREQLLREHASHPDADELIAFLESITHPTRSVTSRWSPGPRDMVDLCELTMKYYLDARMGGSNSIKQVLPAVLNRSDYLREKYSQPIYGAQDGIPSKNFQGQRWVEADETGQIRDPYRLLPPLFEEDFDPGDVEFLLNRGDEKINEGGAAMTAFARMQFTEMGEPERAALREALLKYCELDTLAMVMIIEAWREWLDLGE